MREKRADPPSPAESKRAATHQLSYFTRRRARQYASGHDPEKARSPQMNPPQSLANFGIGTLGVVFGRCGRRRKNNELSKGESPTEANRSPSEGVHRTAAVARGDRKVVTAVLMTAASMRSLSLQTCQEFHAGVISALRESDALLPRHLALRWWAGVDTFDRGSHGRYAFATMGAASSVAKQSRNPCVTILPPFGGYFRVGLQQKLRTRTLRSTFLLVGC
jgi:hypothetical protein